MRGYPYNFPVEALLQAEVKIPKHSYEFGHYFTLMEAVNWLSRTNGPWITRVDAKFEVPAPLSQKES